MASLLSSCTCCVPIRHYVRYLIPGGQDRARNHGNSNSNNNTDNKVGHSENIDHVVYDLPPDYGGDTSRQSPPRYPVSPKSPVVMSPVTQSPGFNDDIDTDVKKNYVSSQILSLEKTGEIDPDQLKKVSDKPPSYLKLSCSASGYQQNGHSHGHRHVTPPRGSASDTSYSNKLVNGSLKQDSVLTNGHIEGHDELTRSNGHTDLGHDHVDSHRVLSEDKSSCKHSTQPTTNGTSTYKKDGAYFLQIVDSEERRLKTLVEKLESLLQTPDIPEEASGSLRTAVGKTNLLINKKFPHFRGFCNRNLNPREDQKKTTPTDLEGLWATIIMQIEDVTNMYSRIDDMKRTGWKTPMEETKENRSPQSNKTKAKKTPVKKGKSTPNKELDEAAKAREEARSKAREEARKRLIAAKKAGRQRKASQSDEVEIFVQT